jgi:hypothetical protein
MLQARFPFLFVFLAGVHPAACGIIHVYIRF